MHLVAPNGRKKKWDIRFRNHDGKTVKLAGLREAAATRRLGDRVQMLLDAKAHGYAPPAELRSWITNLQPAFSDRLVDLGLLDEHKRGQRKTLEEHAKDFEAAVRARKTNTDKHARRQGGHIRRLFSWLGVTRLEDVNEDAVNIQLKQRVKAVATRHHYIVALKDFAKWMLKNGRATRNPVVDLKPPGQYADPTVERMPLTVAQFQTLMAHLDTFDRHPHQFAEWSAQDRKLIYWTAVKPGFRKTELFHIRKGYLHLDEQPPSIGIKSRESKNRTAGEVAIPDDLADALREYTRDMCPAEKVFKFPKTTRSVVEMFRRDLTAAGIEWKLETGEIIDFHTLRSTAITWWLDVDGLPAKRVQILARLKTLALVAQYSRNLKISDFTWLNQGPVLVSDSRNNSPASEVKQQTA